MGDLFLLFLGVHEPQIRNQGPGKKEIRKIPVKGKVNQITLLWGSASNRKRTL